MKRTCDFCGETKEAVVTTQYGSTHYTRLICQDCIKEINRQEMLIDGREVLNADGTYKEEK